MKYVVTIGILAPCLLVAGCPGNNNAANPNANSDDSTSAPALHPATWQRVSGNIFAQPQYELTHMVLNDDSTVDLYYRHPDLGFVVRYWGLFEQGSTTLTVAAAGDLMSVPEMLAYKLPDPNTLELTSVYGDGSVFTRAALPTDVQCPELTALNTFPGVPEPHVGTGLAYDGLNLLYGNADYLVQAVTLDGHPAYTAEPTRFQVHAYQDGGLWLTSGGPGGTDEVQRRDTGDVLFDSVNTTDLGASTRVRSIAYDAGSHVLWLHGPANDVDGYRLLRVDSDSEPDVLLAAEQLDISVEAMTFGGGSLWLLIDYGRHIVQFDPATLTPERSYVAPRSAAWDGLAWIDGSLFLIGTSAGEGVLIQTQP
jgi:hypothetical protein